MVVTGLLSLDPLLFSLLNINLTNGTFSSPVTIHFDRVYPICSQLTCHRLPFASIEQVVQQLLLNHAVNFAGYWLGELNNSSIPGSLVPLQYTSIFFLLHLAWWLWSVDLTSPNPPMFNYNIVTLILNELKLPASFVTLVIHGLHSSCFHLHMCPVKLCDVVLPFFHSLDSKDVACFS